MLVVYIILGVAALIGVLAFIAPKSFTVERTKIVQVAPEVAFNTLKSLREMEEWSPWSKKDPNMKVQFHGEDGTVGSYSHWQGNKEVGEGQHEIKSLKPFSYIEGELRFLKPWKTTSKGYFHLQKQENNQTEITWGIEGNSQFPFNVMMLFMNMDKAVGKDFEQGLDSFKSYIENK